ncbi:MAG: 3'(2'),5'-bisphosphate nucleotidase CysQ [Bacteroides sp.]
MKYINLLIAIEAALKAGEEILSIYNDPASDFEIERKADHSPLTIADRRAHETIVDLLSYTPFPILSEEGKHLEYAVRKHWKELWIVDPLDGTKEFIKRNDEFTVNIALVRNSIPILGVIYLPVKRELYFADEFLGAYKISDITRLESSTTVKALVEQADKLPLNQVPDHFVIVASRSHLTQQTEAYIDAMRLQHGEVELMSCGSSIKICRVAEGIAQVYPRFAPTMEWDTAAGHAIAREAGMEIYQTDGETPLRYNKEDLLNPWFIVERKKTVN